MNKYLLLSFLLFSTSPIIAQQGMNALTPNVNPPSPEAAALGKFVEHPVSNFTGTPEITIPLLEIKTGRITLPIKLSYHGSGIKVDEIASRVGIGWALEAGGVVTRVMKGLPDEIAQLPYQDGGGYFATNGAPTIDPMNDWQTDLDPDEHFYNFNGKQGKIYFTTPSTPYVVGVDPIKVNGPYNRSDGKFVITAEDGIIYTFADTEITNGGLGFFAFNYTSSWYLTQIYDPVTDFGVTFQYRTDMPAKVYYDWVNNGMEAPPCGSSSRISATRTPLSNIRVLQKITYSGGYIEFKAVDRQDYQGDKAYTEINQYTTTGDAPILKKGYNLTYAYTSNGSDFTNKRMFLESVQEKGTDGSFLPPYSFYYKNRDQLPERASAKQDIWGYYNGSSATGNETQTPKVFIRGGICLPFDAVDHYSSSIVDGLDRNTNTAFTDYGTLSKIIYPTKGFTTYTYETHEFGSYQTGGIRIKEIDDYDVSNSLLLSKKYTYSLGFIGGQLPGVGYCLFDGSSMSSSGTVVRFSNNQSILGSCNGSYVGYEFVNVQQVGPSGNNGSTSYHYSAEQDVPGTFSAILAGCPGLSNLSSIRASSSFPFFQMESREQRRGLLLSEEYLDAADNSIKAIKYDYKLYSTKIATLNSFYVTATQDDHGPYINEELQGLRSLNVEKEVLVLKTESLNKGNDDDRTVQPIISNITSYNYTDDGSHDGQFVRKETHWTGTPVPDPNAQYDPSVPFQYQYLPARSTQTIYTYPFDYASTASSGTMGVMATMNYLPVISTINLRITSDNNPINYYTGAKITNYNSYSYGVPQSVLPSQVYTLTLPNAPISQNPNGSNGTVEVTDPANPGSLYDKRVEYLEYDESGNPAMILQDKKYTLLDWGDLGDRLYFKTLTSDPSLPGMTTRYDYDSFDRLKTVIDPDNRTKTYEYDVFGRLVNIKDKDGSILKHFDYHFSGQ